MEARDKQIMSARARLKKLSLFLVVVGFRLEVPPAYVEVDSKVLRIPSAAKAVRSPHLLNSAG